jgi:hypothetical protein
MSIVLGAELSGNSFMQKKQNWLSDTEFLFKNIGTELWRHNVQTRLHKSQFIFSGKFSCLLLSFDTGRHHINFQYMKTINRFPKIILLLVLLISAFTMRAQNPTYLYKITNEVAVSTQDYQFDVFLLRTGATTLEVANTNMAVGFDTSILNGGTPTFTIINTGGPGTVAGSPNTWSEMNLAQYPTTVTPAGTGVSTGTRNTGGIIYRFMNVSARTSPGSGNGTVISNIDGGCTHPGTRIGRFQLHNSIPFKCNVTAKHIFSTVLGGGGISNQVLSAYVNTVATSINVASSNQSWLAGQTPSTCTQNIILNACETTCSVTASISNNSSPTCLGGNNGSVLVTLSGPGTSSTSIYSLDGGPVNPASTNPFTVSGLSAGVHSVVVTTNIPCTSNTATWTTALGADPNDNNVCTSDACTVANGVTHNPITNTGGGASDGLVCTSDDCNNGVTEHHTLPTDDNNPCTADGCNEPGGVFHTNLTSMGGGESDGLACTSDDCNNGVTVHNAVNTNDNNPCTADGCNEPGGVFYIILTNTGGGASDGLVCTSDDCNNGVTVHITVNTNDNNPCTVDGCNEPSGVFHNTNPVIVTAIQSAPVQCFGYTTCVNVSASGGSGNYSSGTGTPCGLGAGDYTFTVTDNAGCSGTSGNVHITEPEKIEGIASSTSTTCGGSTGTATVTPIGGSGTYTGYSWNSIPVQNTQTATGLPVGTFTVTITDDEGCTGTASVTITNEGEAPAQLSQILGPAGACKGQTGVVYSVTNVPGITYTWSLPAGASGSSNVNTISVNFSTTYAGGFICVTAINACGTSSPSCISVPVITGRPAFPVTPSGPSMNVCGPTTVNYSIPPVTNAISYVWTVTGTGFTLGSGQGTTSITVNVASGFTSGQVRVFASSCSGISGENSLTVYGLISSQPQQAIFPNIGVCGGNTYAYAITPFNGASSITWSGPTGSLINGLPTPQTFSGNTFSVNITFPVGFVSGNVSVFGSNGCGNSPSRVVLVRSVPAQPPSITGPNSVECSQNNVTYSTLGSPGAASYIWSLPTGVTGSSTSNSITVNFTGTFSGVGNICVIPVNNCGSGSQRCLIVLCHTSGTPTQNIEGLRIAQQSREINVYPNPSSGKFNLLFHSETTEKYILKVTDMIGYVLISQLIISHEGENSQEVNLNDFAKGLYLLSIENEGKKIQTRRILVQ